MQIYTVFLAKILLVLDNFTKKTHVKYTLIHINFHLIQNLFLTLLNPMYNTLIQFYHVSLISETFTLI